MITKILNGYTSQDTALLIPDYPYGRKLRCKIRYWCEYDEKKGFRFCSQTENPKNLVWNAPKRSTYRKIAMQMFLDERGYVMHSALSEFSDENEVLQFIKNFAEMDQDNKRSLTVWCIMKKKMHEEFIADRAYFTINGQKQDTSESEIERYKEELKVWEECVSLLKG